MNLPQTLINQLTSHAIASVPNECCGYIYRDVFDGLRQRTSNELKYYPATNIHQSPTTDFAIDAIDYINADRLGDVIALFHSHTDASPENGKLDFSPCDRIACEESGLVWVLCVMPQQEIKIMRPSGYIAPLIGREFVYGVSDCYALVRDAFKMIDIQLNDYPRGESVDEFENPDWDMFDKHFANEGFIVIDKYGALQKYDVLLMQIQSTKINHIGLMWECDRNLFIHHLRDRLSEESVYGGYWERCTIKVVRHRNLGK